MSAVLFRDFAERCHELARHARSDATREQLRLWAEEFETQAEQAEGGEPGNRGVRGR